MSAEGEGAWLQDHRRNHLQDSLHSLSLGAVQAFAPRIADCNGPAELSAEVAPRHCSRKIQMRTIVGVHDGRNRNDGALEARDRVGILRGILVALLPFLPFIFAFSRSHRFSARRRRSRLSLTAIPRLRWVAFSLLSLSDSRLGIGEKKGG